MVEQRPQDAHIRIYPLGTDGYVLRVSDSLTEAANATAIALAKVIAPLEGVIEAAPSLTSVFVRFDPVKVARAAFVALLEEKVRDFRADDDRAQRRWTIPVCFDASAAPQLTEVANMIGLGQEALIGELCAARLSVLALGFAPGQPYLGILPEAWDIPRQTSLTEAVPQGAITVAVRQIVLFANRSATGWRQIGQTGFRPFDLGRAAPVALTAGDEVRFVPIGRGEFDGLLSDPMGGARLETL
ncbi:carboxyltransferase domain-containing protein [Marivivens sp. LCG002]|uniref:5-oxoprolinase subunit B family protein n=1 Tax=Marivivens sp. LCG002 TaxID=3051171 RepID=UPI0025544C3C|nr:carboxyltransferase domain-containing protein [Marivivens sp. LCG002]WIV49678.1 carboxyltransferase domain-containing protein [Marivivens sp. LCG002]